MKRAVITGPTGAIGTALIAELISHGIEVEAVVRPDSRRTDNIPKSPLVHIVPCDLKELKTLHENTQTYFTTLAGTGRLATAVTTLTDSLKMSVMR